MPERSHYFPNGCKSRIIHSQTVPLHHLVDPNEDYKQYYLPIEFTKIELAP
jgi:hypothetical protein